MSGSLRQMASRCDYLFLDSQLGLDPLRVRLGPNEGRIDQPHFLQAAELLEADGKQILRLEFTWDPTGPQRGNSETPESVGAGAHRVGGCSQRLQN